MRRNSAAMYRKNYIEHVQPETIRNNVCMYSYGLERLCLRNGIYNIVLYWFKGMYMKQYVYDK